MLRPAIRPTQPTDPKQFMQKSAQPHKKEKAESKGKEKAGKPAADAAAGQAKAAEKEAEKGKEKSADKKVEKKEAAEKDGAEADKGEGAGDMQALEAMSELFAEPEAAAEQANKPKVAELPEDAKQEAAEGPSQAAEKKEEAAAGVQDAAGEKEAQLEADEAAKQGAAEEIPEQAKQEQE